MSNYLMQSGPPVWLVLALGIVALIAALRYAMNGQVKQRQLALAGGVATVIVGVLGTVVGLQKSIGGLRQVAAEDRWIYLFGLKESLNNLVIALLFAVIVSLVLMVANYRQASLREAH